MREREPYLTSDARAEWQQQTAWAYYVVGSYDGARRMAEAARLGYEHAIIPTTPRGHGQGSRENRGENTKSAGLHIQQAGTLREAISLLDR